MVTTTGEEDVPAVAASDAGDVSPEGSGSAAAPTETEPCRRCFLAGGGDEATSSCEELDWLSLSGDGGFMRALIEVRFVERGERGTRLEAAVSRFFGVDESARADLTLSCEGGREVVRGVVGSAERPAAVLPSGVCM